MWSFLLSYYTHIHTHYKLEKAVFCIKIPNAFIEGKLDNDVALHPYLLVIMTQVLAEKAEVFFTKATLILNVS